MQQAGGMARPFDFGQFGQAQTGDQAREQAINAAMGSAQSRLDPMWQRREDMQRTQLLNQGLDPSSEAYRNAMSETGMQRNDAYNQAMFSAIGQGTQAGDVAFRNNMMARQQAIADALRQRQLPMQELQQMHGFLGQMPTFAQDNSRLQGALGAAQFAQGAAEQEQERKAQQDAATAQLVGGGLSAAGGATAAILAGLGFMF